MPCRASPAAARATAGRRPGAARRRRWPAGRTARSRPAGRAPARRRGRTASAVSGAGRRRRRPSGSVGRRPAARRRRGGRRRRTSAGAGAAAASPAVERLELLLDDPQRQVVVALRGQHVAQPAHVGRGELPVARRRALRVDQVLGLQVADLADRHVGEVVAKNGQHLADGQARRVLIGGVPERAARAARARARHSALRRLAGPRAGEVDEPELADLHLVAAGQRRRRRPARG